MLGYMAYRVNACYTCEITQDVHHGHRVVVLSETEREVLEELGSDAREVLLGQAELLLDVIEDAPAGVGRGRISRVGLAHDGRG